MSKGKFLALLLTFFAFANAENYKIELYDDNKSTTKGFWHIVGVGTLSTPPTIPAPPTTGNTVISSVVENSTKDGIKVIDRDHLGDETEMKDIVTIENMNGSNIPSITLWIDEQTYSPLKYFVGDPKDTMFVKLEDSSGITSQLKIKFKEPLNGATFYLQYEKADGSNSERYSAVFTHDTSINEPIVAEFVNLAESGLTLEALEETKSVKEVIENLNGEFPITSELRIYKYDGEWHYYSNKNSDEQNDFLDLQGGYGYWMKLDGNPTTGSDVSGELKLNDGYFKLDATNVDTYSEYYKTILKDGWNLITTPDSTIRNSITAVKIDTSVSAIDGANTTIEVMSSGKVKELNISDTTVTNSLELARALNRELKELDVRAFNISSDGVLIISNNSFTLTETDSAGTGIGAVETLFGELLTSDLNATAIKSKIEGIGLLFKQNIVSDFNVTNYEEVYINGNVVGFRELGSTAVDLGDLNITIDTNFDGNFDENDTVAVISKNEFTAKELVTQRAYELDLEYLVDNWTADGNNSNDSNYTIHIQDTEILISNSDVAGEEDIANLIKDLINSKTANSGVKAYVVNSDLTDKKADLFLALDKNINKPLRAYDQPINSSMLLKPKSGFFGNIKGVYPLYSLVNSEVASDGNLSIPTSINSPTTTEIRTDLKPVANSLSAINRAGYDIAKILTAHTNTENGSIDWDYVNFNVPDDKWFNNPDEQMDLMSFDKSKGYWFYLKESETPADTTPFAIVGEPSINLAFEHYYDNNNSITYNVFIASITIQVEYDDLTTKERVEGYIEIAGKRFNLNKGTTGDEFSVDIQGYCVGELSNIQSIDIYFGDGRGNFELKSVPLDRVKPEKPSLEIVNYDDLDAILNIEKVLVGDENSSSIKKFIIYNSFISSSDNREAFALSVDSSEEAITEATITDVFNNFKDVTLANAETTLSVIGLDENELGLSYISDIAKIDVVPLHCLSHKLTAEVGIESKTPTKYDETCAEIEDDDFTDGGVSFETYNAEGHLYYSPIENVVLERTEVPEIMFIGLEDEIVGRIRFNHSHLGAKFYVSYNGKLYKGEFSKGHENIENGTLYLLKGGDGDSVSGKEVY